MGTGQGAVRCAQGGVVVVGDACLMQSECWSGCGIVRSRCLFGDAVKVRVRVQL